MTPEWTAADQLALEQIWERVTAVETLLNYLVERALEDGQLLGHELAEVAAIRDDLEARQALLRPFLDEPWPWWARIVKPVEEGLGLLDWALANS